MKEMNESKSALNEDIKKYLESIHAHLEYILDEVREINNKRKLGKEINQKELIDYPKK